MVARSYFDRERPHLDDVDLVDAIQRGIVPGEIDEAGRWARGCLRGGPFVLELARAGHDPCLSCPGPEAVNGGPSGRARCGGRPPKDVADLAVPRGMMAESAAARRTKRAGLIGDILRIAAAKKP